MTKTRQEEMCVDNSAQCEPARDYSAQFKPVRGQFCSNVLIPLFFCVRLK